MNNTIKKIELTEGQALLLSQYFGKMPSFERVINERSYSVPVDLYNRFEMRLTKTSAEFFDYMDIRGSERKVSIRERAYKFNEKNLDIIVVIASCYNKYLPNFLWDYPEYQRIVNAETAIYNTQEEYIKIQQFISKLGHLDIGDSLMTEISVVKEEDTDKIKVPKYKSRKHVLKLSSYYINNLLLYCLSNIEADIFKDSHRIDNIRSIINAKERPPLGKWKKDNFHRSIIVEWTKALIKFTQDLNIIASKTNAVLTDSKYYAFAADVYSLIPLPDTRYGPEGKLIWDFRSPDYGRDDLRGTDSLVRAIQVWFQVKDKASK
ncbi:MAG TPA: hypothetical protein VK783_11060 [Bacteroidia bacterium]|jgi:hypothetical protein|nr:hypothetical protein [Bacteroidia bacterium]